MRSFFFSYIGGKSRDLKSILPYVDLSNIETIVEPFCGSCAFSSHIEGDYKFCFNDIDEGLINFLQNIDKFDKYVKYYNDNYSKYIKDGQPTSKWRELIENHDTIEKYYLWKRISSRGSLMRLSLKDENTEDYSNLVKLFKNAKIQHGDYRGVINDYLNDEHSFIFLDPPYLNSFNSDYDSYSKKQVNEKHEIIDNTYMYIDFIDILEKAKCKVMLIINSNSLTKYLYRNFIKGSYAKRYDITGKRTEHLIVANY